MNAHKGQVDKVGAPYYLHPYAVADMLGSNDEKATAYLHDVLEDTDATSDDLRAESIPERVIEAVEAMTHPEGQSYFEYLETVKRNSIARAVKLADLEHNTDPSRKGATPEMLARYERAKRILAK